MIQYRKGRLATQGLQITEVNTSKKLSKIPTDDVDSCINRKTVQRQAKLATSAMLATRNHFANQRRNKFVKTVQKEVEENIVQDSVPSFGLRKK